MSREGLGNAAPNPASVAGQPGATAPRCFPACGTFRARALGASPQSASSVPPEGCIAGAAEHCRAASAETGAASAETGAASDRIEPSGRPSSPLATLTRLEYHALKAAWVGCRGLSLLRSLRARLRSRHRFRRLLTCCRPLWRHGRRREDQRAQLRVIISVRGEEDEVLLELLLVVHALLQAAQVLVLQDRLDEVRVLLQVLPRGWVSKLTTAHRSNPKARPRSRPQIKRRVCVWRRPRAPSPRRPRAAGSQPSFRARVRAMAARANREPGVNKRTLIVWLYVSPNFFSGRPLAAPPADCARTRPEVRRARIPLRISPPWPPVTRRRRTSPPSYTCPAPGMHLARAGHRSMR